LFNNQIVPLGLVGFIWCGDCIVFWNAVARKKVNLQVDLDAGFGFFEPGPKEFSYRTGYHGSIYNFKKWSLFYWFEREFFPQFMYSSILDKARKVLGKNS